MERLVTSLFSGRIVPEPQPREMFTVPKVKEGEAGHSAGLQRFAYGGTVYWAKSGARYGYANGIAATRDLRRTLVYSVGATDAKGDSMNAVTQRIVLAALARP
ncbi:hypothetical protein STEPF1_02462 [Streptomyces sp. F-1]|nr:hypothetical protein STEPF1_02462 [Streptomyces sp. F-1]